MTELEAIAQEVAACHLCELAKDRNLTVPGVGNPNAEILFVGEAPGWHENQHGRPFVGPAGQLLEQLLKSVSLRREDVFITNVVKCRPPQNRDPLPEEIQACSGYLDRQLALIKPKLIVTLGRFSMGRFFPFPGGKNRPMENLPRVTISFGLISANWRSRYPEHAWISSGSGSRFCGGRHFTTLVMKTSSRRSDTDFSNCSNSCPAGPTNGRPCWFSCQPGASPTKKISAFGFPTPGTVRFRSLANSHRWQAATSWAIASSSVILPSP